MATPVLCAWCQDPHPFGSMLPKNKEREQADWQGHAPLQCYECYKEEQKEKEAAVPTEAEFKKMVTKKWQERSRQQTHESAQAQHAFRTRSTQFKEMVDDPQYDPEGRPVSKHVKVQHVRGLVKTLAMTFAA